MNTAKVVLVSFLFVLHSGFAQSLAPVLYFSDITSGPKAGNTDISLGQVSEQNGAVVTIWGRYLDGATVYCNGAQAAYYYARSNATQPADLYRFHKIQTISFQISHLAQDGVGSIYAVVSGQQSNALPFTVRQGNIFFAKTSGDDNSGTGSWTLPWRTIVKAKNSLSPGDIVYIGNGVNQTEMSDFNACVNLDSDGLPGSPKALLVYPGAVSRVGNDTLGRAFHNFQPDSDRAARHWVIARFTIATSELGIPTNTGWRAVGNYITAPNGSGLDGAIDVVGNDVAVYGNELDSVGSAGCDKLYHAIYVFGERRDTPPRAPTESNRDVGWNYIHDSRSNRAINIYSEQPYAAFIEGHRVHDNVIANQHGDGILLGNYVTGENWIYNNLIIKAGLGPEWVTGESYHTGIRIDCGHEQRTNANVYCYNNTLFGCGWSGAVLAGETGHLLIGPDAFTRSTSIRFVNNIVFSTGEPYLAGESGTPAAASYTNCWFGAGGAPAWDLTAINLNPLFVDTTTTRFQLQSGSPCINVGQNVSSVVGRDLLGVPRPYGSGFDLGVFEHHPLTGIDQNKQGEVPGVLFTLDQNYPNPFNPTTTIQYSLPSQSTNSVQGRVGVGSYVTLKVIDVLGREVSTLANGLMQPGTYSVHFDASNLSSGVYFCRLTVGEFTDVKKMMVAR